MQFLSLGIDCGHGARELFVDTIVDRDRTVIGILTVEAALGRLVGVLEPVVADEVAFLQGRGDLSPKAGRALGLGRHLRSGAVAVGQP